MNEASLDLQSALGAYPAVPGLARRRLAEALEGFRQKVVVLDDDPTGVQTVHGVHVYTQWSGEAFLEGFRPRPGLLHPDQLPRLHRGGDRRAHREIAKNLLGAARRRGGVRPHRQERLDAAGHYPLETAVSAEALKPAARA